MEKVRRIFFSEGTMDFLSLLWNVFRYIKEFCAMKKRWKMTMFTAVALGMIQTTAVWAADINMNLFYNGKNHAYHAKEIKLEIDGEEFKDPNMPAVSIDGRMMLPMRGICQKLGCEVTWNPKTNEAYAIKDNQTVVFAVNKKTGYKNGNPFAMDVPPLIINDRTMLPVRALADALDVDIEWDQESRTVHIGKEAVSNTTEKQEEKPHENPEEIPQEKPVVQQKVKLTGIEVPQGVADAQRFTISASGSLGQYEEVQVSNNKVVLDFYDAENGLAENTRETGCGFVTAIRTGQHTKDGRIYTRVVFDLTGQKQYTIKPSNDRRQVFIEFTQTQVTGISTANGGNADVVTIHGNGSLGARVSTLQNPYRVVIDMPGVRGEADTTVDSSGLDRITAIRTGYVNGDTYRVVLDTAESPNLKWEEKNGTLTVRVEDSTLKNISYDNARNVLLLKADQDINPNSVRHYDEYLNGYYELILPGNYESIYGYGKRDLEDDKVSSIEVSTKNGSTAIRFNQNTINAYTVRKTDGYYEIAVRNPKEIYNKVLVLDAGHGGNDPGTHGNGMEEKNVTLSVAMKIERYIKAHSDIKVYVTRNNDSRPANANRAKMANEIADFMVSIHMNAGAVQANGTETLYAKHSNDNDGTLTSLQAAQVVQRSLTAALNTTNRGVKHRPDLLILNSTYVPAILVETCFLSNPGDALKISSDAGQEKAAEAIGQAIIQIMNTSRLR